MSDAPLIPASTLVLISRHGKPLSVLLLQRAPTLRAFPGLWAFPGGRVDAVDCDTRWLSGLQPNASVLARLMQARDQSPLSVKTADYLQCMRIKAEAPSTWMPDRGNQELWPYWVAAVRECYEETGLALANWNTGGPLNFGSFYYLGRLVPPPQVPYRFDTRFFAVLVDQFPVVVREPEATSYRWIGVHEALAQLELANPTRYVLLWLSQWCTAAAFENRWQKDEDQWKS
ncbi:MAG: NUDIX hydrolase [Sulfobacillus acidophilus]|uniref:NUDIX hydrolase n=1 Tax=Sulfobacillus acidophilus TaxID=53633 RepID=A0A2T2WKW6_9FIRM|nr:MAG: NUDIX hydrolase [Sulfobacillus acidophilus]